MYTDGGVERAIYTDAARQRGIFGTCASATTFTCTAIFQCLSILTIDFPPNCFDYCDVIDSQLAIISRTSIHISIKKWPMVKFPNFADDRSEVCGRLEDCYSDWQEDDET